MCRMRRGQQQKRREKETDVDIEVAVTEERCQHGRTDILCASGRGVDGGEWWPKWGGHTAQTLLLHTSVHVTPPLTIPRTARCHSPSRRAKGRAERKGGRMHAARRRRTDVRATYTQGKRRFTFSYPSLSSFFLCRLFCFVTPSCDTARTRYPRTAYEKGLPTRALFYVSHTSCPFIDCHHSSTDLRARVMCETREEERGAQRRQMQPPPFPAPHRGAWNRLGAVA